MFQVIKNYTREVHGLEPEEEVKKPKKPTLQQIFNKFKPKKTKKKIKKTKKPVKKQKKKKKSKCDCGCDQSIFIVIEDLPTRLTGSRF